MKRAAALLLAGLLAGCGADSTGDQAKPGDGGQAEKLRAGAAPVHQGSKTPNEDRIATLGLLNKRNNLTQDIILKTGDSRQVGNVTIKLESCERTAPWESNQETGAFVQVMVEERPAPRKDPEWHTVFSGWLFKNSPALNVVEHPVYDVWVKDCAMNFPGDEPKPAASASRQSAAKASDSGSGAVSGE